MQDRLQERLWAVWRAVRGIYAGEVAETRARRWWSRRDREIARGTVRLIEARALSDRYRAALEDIAARRGACRNGRGPCVGGVDAAKIAGEALDV